MIRPPPPKKLSAYVPWLAALAIAVCAIGWWLGNDAARRNEYPSRKAVAVDREGVKYEAWQASAAPFPFQAVRVRWRVVNDGTAPLLRCAPPDALFQSPMVLREHESQPIHAERAMVWIDSAYRNTPNTTARERQNGVGYALLPGECSSGSGALAAVWTRNNKPARVGDPLFAAPGRYRISVVLPRPRQDFPSLAVMVEVLEPKGAEKHACDALERDHKLRSALMSPIDVPGFSLAPRLEKFIDEYGQTSYADYARFALARHFLRGAGPRTRNQDTEDKIATSMHSYFNAAAVESASDRRTLLRQRFRHFFFPAGFSEEASEAIDAMATAAAESDEANYNSAARKLASLIHVSDEERRAGIRLLEEVKSSTRQGFAYMPNVLVALKCTLEATGSERSKEIRDTMESSYPDAIEVVEEIAHEASAEKWRDFRVTRCADPRRLVGDSIATSKAPIALQAACLSPDPYPYQAVRIRWRVCNEGQVTLGPRSWGDGWLANLQYGRPEEKLRPTYLLVALCERTAAAALALPSHGRTVALAPSECCELSAALAADWSSVAGDLRISQPLFPTAGSYIISATYTFDPPTEGHATLQTPILVREPQGDELAAFNALTEDIELRNALMSPIGAPHLPVVPRLEKFLADFGQTSYANYARFALARHHMRGSGSSLQRDRLGAGAFADDLIKSHYAADAQDALKERLQKWAAQRASLDEVANKAIDDAVSWYFQSEHLFRGGVELLAGATGATRDARRAALKILKEIVATGDGGFAYMPSVFIAIAECARLTGEWVGDMGFVLRAEYSGAAEVIDYFAGEVSEQDWKRLRVTRTGVQLSP